ncbi:MAG: hypothetical protein ABIH17_12585 [Pseudomonadota bacterium]
MPIFRKLTASRDKPPAATDPKGAPSATPQPRRRAAAGGPAIRYLDMRLPPGLLNSRLLSKPERETARQIHAEAAALIPHLNSS